MQRLSIFIMFIACYLLSSAQVDERLTDLSRYIAGMPAPTFTLDDKLNDAIPSDYSEDCESAFDRLNEKHLEPISEWASSSSVISDSDRQKTLFYPFAGADFIYADAFFGEVDNMILIGQQNAGTLPDFDAMSQYEIKEYLNAIYNSLSISNRLGFFRTKDMNRQFRDTHVNGTIHSILWYMARAEMKIVSIRNVRLTSSGRLETSSSKEGIEVIYSDKGQEKKLYYFAYDLSNSNLSSNPRLFDFLESFGKHNVLVKSASYLMHNSSFSIIREYLMNTSHLVVQDPSGIPYRKLVAAGCSVDLHGTYTRPIPLFSGYSQSSLKEAIKSAPDLPFMIGYMAPYGECSLAVFKGCD
ncbi:MAG: hypothetical protein VXX44_03950 [Bacteroidota bacterium]|nr:hypothetical protein [Bacteroidota bacterium]